MEVFVEYIFNNMPAHLIYLADDGWKLVGRAELCDLFQPIRSPDEANLSKEQIIERLVKPALKFAIFSHRWFNQGEPTFQDMMRGENLEGAAYEKLLGFCAKAELHGCLLAWSDTCCIDKTSSAELQEAIRSMFDWYRNAHICIAHLSDSDKGGDITKDRWFTRGWTLQELLAPARMKFYDKSWQDFTAAPNDKDHTQMLDALCRATGIPKRDLEHFVPATARVQEKMYWASKRRTTKIEDAAYSLMGIFDVSIPVVYGEGHVSFHRLVEEIMRRCDELWVFAWAGPSSGQGNTNAIPRSPRCYSHANFTGFPPDEFDPVSRIELHGDRDFSLTRRGLRIKLTFVKGKMNPTNGGTFEFVPDDSIFQHVVVHTSWQGTLAGDEKWALAILNYKRGIDRNSKEIAIIHPSTTYLCWLCIVGDNGSCRKVATSNILTLRTHPGAWYDSRAPLGEPLFL
jgi:hypothetical protein